MPELTRLGIDRCALHRHRWVSDDRQTTGSGDLQIYHLSRSLPLSFQATRIAETIATLRRSAP